MKMFDLAEVSLHNNKNDCWVIINARVYDVTRFLNDHPGGDTVLLDVAGKNASEEFEEAGHGSAARLMLDEYYVGETDPLTLIHDVSTIKNRKAETHLKQHTIMEENMRSCLDFTLKSTTLLLLLVVLGGAIGFKFYN